MSGDLHISDFYKDVARIFHTLYQTFPRKIILYVEDISGPADYDEVGLPDARFEACFSTMLWLAEHGYLTYNSLERQQGIEGAVLTQQSFLLLSSHGPFEPDSKSRSAPRIESVRAALRSGSSLEVDRVMHGLLSLSQA